MASKNDHDNGNDPIEAVLSEFREAWYAGERVDPESFCRDHPECGPALQEAIEDFLFVAERLPHAYQGEDGDAAGSPAVGDFKILREIGRGGMGTVYEAEQISLGRKVALKILPAHLSFSKTAVLKFRREAEAGGRQSHPGIVSVFAVGENKGVHYIAQEFMEGGRTLADWLDELRKEEELPKGHFRKAARILRDVADALQHAHDAGVIHRDVKPTNILMTPEGTPKVTDFGLAKVEDALSLSRTGDFSGTPFYMSPEQISRRRIKLDSRTDIYSLGVTLYEVLTLNRPFEGKTSHDVFKKIMVHEPQDPRRVNSRVPRDLAVICLKAMEKDPAKRYQNMADFCADLERYLSGEMVQARPAGYRTRSWKWMRRNPVWSASTGVGLMAVIAFLGYVLLWSYPRIMEERDNALTARETAEAMREQADAEAENARTEAAISKTVLDFLTGLFESPDPKKAQGAEITAKEILDRGVERFQSEFEDQPGIKARLLSTMGNVYVSLGQLSDAEPLLEQALELRRESLAGESSELYSSAYDLASLYHQLGCYDEARSLFLESLDGLRRILGKDHHNTLIVMKGLTELYQSIGDYEKAESLCIETLDGCRRGLGIDHPLVLSTRNSLANICLDQAKFEEGKSLLVEALEDARRIYGNDHPETLVMMGNLAGAYMELGEFKEAEPLLLEAIERLRRVLGNEHVDTLTNIQCLGCLYLLTGQFKKAEPLFIEALEGLRWNLGDDHPTTSTTIMNLAVLYREQGRFEEAKPLYEEMLENQRRTLGGKHPSTLTSMINLAVLYKAQGRDEQAEKLYLEAVEGYRLVLPDSTHRFVGMQGLASLYMGQERFKEAEELLLEALEGQRRLLGNDHPDTLSSLRGLADLYQYQDRDEEAESFFLESVKGYRRVLGENHPDTLAAESSLGGLYMHTGKLEAAEPLLTGAYEGMCESVGLDAPSTQVALYYLVIVKARRGKNEEAEKLATTLLEHTPLNSPDYKLHEDMLLQIRKKLGEIESDG